MAISSQVVAQNPMGRYQSMGRMGGTSGTKDSLKRRDNLEDSITIRYRYLDTTRLMMLDSSIIDFRARFPIPMDYLHLSNLGSAAKPYAFSPRLTSGWDPGFHAFDIYKNPLDKVRFFQTTRPYSELGYMLGSRGEQNIHLLHTQNIRPNWNFAFKYELINSPGFFKNQNTNHNSYVINSFYNSKNKRYSLYFIWIGNSMQANENGGMKTDKDYLNDVITYKERSTIPVMLGNYVAIGQSFLNSTLNTGNRQKEGGLLIRQQYDLGQRDSLVTDSTVIPLFYPKLRMEYTFQYNNYQYKYYDSEPDTPIYIQHYNFLVTPPAKFTIEERWSEIVNDFSLYTFPVGKNPQQFLKAGASIQNLTGNFTDGKRTYYNIFLHGEYRNKTRNKKWDIEANGKFYLAGYNNADFDLFGSLKRYVSRRIGYAQIGLQNVNRTPSFIYETASSFSLGGQPTFNKENITRIFGSIENDARRWQVNASYFLVNNLTYFTDYYKAAQASAFFNVLEVSGQKIFRVSRHWNWLAKVQFNQKIGNGPVNMPLFFTQQRLGYEGKLGYANLVFAAGVEARYHSGYKADNYSPLQSQFFYQDKETIRMKLPDIAAYMHFRIRGFTAYVRAENLNTARFKDGSFGWTNNNLAAPAYAYPGFLLRLGIFWSFVN
ncbi:putative porin [Flavihumibacter profundi]|uniref:putative porin n=1 Tax=Flavihumibacter profundi TaxID=2716883 RepID=UPI001CC4E273|nr:putative porin [Flavihumibacter profundi]MBZ5856679.1 putative porin [Flavihumibacter profundi]